MQPTGDRPLTEEQKVVLNQFRERVKDCQLIDSSDGYLLKWLIARNFHVDVAEKMLRASLEWRRLNRVDEIIDTYKVPEAISKYYSLGRTGTDKFGSPLWVTQQGLIDIRGILNSTTKREMLRFMIYMIELNARQVRLDSGRHQGMTIVADMEFLSVRQMTYGPAITVRDEMVKVYEANYPENLRRIFVINAPRLFLIVYSMIKPFMHQVTIDKVKIFGFDQNEWKAALLEEIDADQLPAYYGGTLTDPDGNDKCPSILNMGGPVPTSMYLTNSKPQPKDGMDTLTISARTKQAIEFEVEEANSVLKWEFLTEGGDISFRVFYKSGGDGDVELVPSARVESHLLMEEGEIVCDSNGQYVIEFDNSFSYFQSKKVYYHVDIAQPSTSL